MKIPAFDYASPETLAEAATILAGSGGEAKIISGGQSLMPVMAFRLANPPLLVDLRRIPGLTGIRAGADAIEIGARTRWRDLGDSAELAAAHPLLSAAIPYIAHYQIRNRGTIGGSIAHGDPAAEMPGLIVACDAEISAFSVRGKRVIKAGDFYQGPLMTSLEADEIVVSIRFPSWKAGRRWGFDEVARRKGDFAITGIATYFDLDAAGRAENVHIGMFGAGDVPRRLSAAERALSGKVVDEATIAAAADRAREEVDPPEDMHASADYRRALVGVLVERTARKAMSLKAA